MNNCRTYVIADIHGRADLLRPLLSAIHKDAKQHNSAHPLLITLGDYIDRGPDSRKVLDILIHKRPAEFSTRFLKGNHEEMFLNFLKDPEKGLVWLNNGGDATLASYGIAVHQATHHLPELREAILKVLPEDHLHFLESLKPYYQQGEYFFVHGGVRPEVPLNQQDEEDLLWIRQEFLNSSQDFGKIVVHGHSIVKNPEIKPNRIALDTGAFYTGKLTCLVLNGHERFFLQIQAS